MKRSWNAIKVILLVALVTVLFGFGNQRNRDRMLTKIDINFEDEGSPFISEDAVNKLLILNKDSVTSIGKETLVLNKMEERLLENPMIRDAQVYVTVDGILGARIEQRNPIARVADSPNYYLDDDGLKMPLSSIYTARVPIVTGNSKEDFTELTPLLLKINEDEFMKNAVVGLHLTRDENVVLSVRKQDIKILFGKLKMIEKKFQNFKAFYYKTKNDNTLDDYKTVNLEFESQVVATKR